MQNGQNLVWKGDPKPKTCPINNFLLNNLGHLQIRPLNFYHHLLENLQENALFLIILASEITSQSKKVVSETISPPS